MTSGGTGGTHLADAKDVEQWAERVGARTDFPKLVRRLIHQTNDQVVELEMRAAEGAGYAGYDGEVRASRGTPFVPEGHSVWELGVGESPAGKAEEDYAKRTSDPLGVDQSQATFVFVTAQRWSGKKTWAAAKRDEGKWRDVRAFDADDLEIAFEAAPVVRFWFGELIGKPVGGVRSIEDWWKSFSRISQPVLTPEMVLAGRANEAAGLLRILEEETRITTISAASVDDVLAFVASTLLTTAESTQADLLARTLIVYDAPALRWLENTANLLVLLPYEEDMRRQAQLITAHHVVLLAEGNIPADVQLPSIDRNGFLAELMQLGVGEEIARRFARAAEVSVSAFQREAPARGAPPRDWAGAFDSKLVRRAWLAGSWNEARSGDVDALASLFTERYEDARSVLAEYARGADPLFTTVGSTWTLSSVVDAWKFGAPHLNLMDLEAVEAVIQTVLGAVDPALELDVDKRWQASIFGKTRIHSTDLRRGLATTVATFGAFGSRQQIGSSGTASEWASGVVSRLLRRANEDASGQLWASLSDVLPLLAEGAPDVFLRAVQEGSAQRVGEAQPLLATMFIDQGDAFSVSSPHTGLLWALETVAWSPEHAPLAIKLLARLGEIDPGGRLVNRPLESLTNIFRPWFPQTSLPADRRLAVLDAIRRDHPSVAWRLMQRLLPEHHGVGGYTSSPDFREWKPATDPSVSRKEFADVSSAIAERVLEDAAQLPERWLDVVEHLSRFPSADREAALVLLRELPPSLPADLRAQIWGRLEKLVRQHRAFPDAEWSLPADELDQIEDAARSFAPSDPADANRWLFIDHLPDIGARADYTTQQARVDDARSDAVAEVLATEGVAGLIRLAQNVAHPWFVGTAGATHGSAELDSALVTHIDDEEKTLADLAAGYSFARARARGLPWILERVAELSARPLAQARLLQNSDDLPRVWEILAQLGEEAEDAYWKEFATGGRGPDFEYVNEAAEALLEHGRPLTAIDLLTLYAEGESRRVSAELVLEALSQLVTLAPDHDEPIGRLSSYELETLLDYLRESEIPDEQLGVLEWRLLPARGYDARSPVLERRLSREPSFFVDVVSMVYRASGEEPGESEVPERVASNAYRLLSDWKTVPGTDEESGRVDELALNAWVDAARTQLAQRKRSEVGDVHIGKVLAYDGADADGSWPSRPVRNLVERLASPEIEEGFETEIYNKRGTTTRSLTAGGDLERELVRSFSAKAQLIRDGWPRTAAVLASVARTYESLARREDEDARRVEEGLTRS